MKSTIKSILFAAALVMPALFSGNALATSESCGTCTVGNAPNTSVHAGVNAAMMACSSCHTGSTSGDGTSGSTLKIKITAKSCGTCAVGSAPAISAHKNVTSTTACSVCHVNGSTGGTGNTMVIRRTSESCGTCAIGTAPAISAHKNVTSTTVCSVCHVGGGTSGVGNIGIKIRPTSHSCGTCMVGTAPSSVSAHKNVNTTNTLCTVCHGATGGTTGGHADDHHGSPSGYTNHRPVSPGNSEFGHSHKRDKKQHRDHDD